MVDKQFLQALRFEVAETGANTYGEEEISTPISIGSKMAMDIQAIEIYMEEQFDTMASGDQCTVQVSKNSKAAISDLFDTDIIAMFGPLDVNMVTSGAINTPRVFQYIVPRDMSDKTRGGLLYALDKIFVGLRCSGQAAAKTVSGRILYYLTPVSSEQFFSNRV